MTPSKTLLSPNVVQMARPRVSQPEREAALIPTAITQSAEVNLFPLRLVQYPIDLGGSAARLIYALISDSKRLIGAC